jgi:hypothetical protein
VVIEFGDRVPPHGHQLPESCGLFDWSNIRALDVIDSGHLPNSQYLYQL